MTRLATGFLALVGFFVLPVLGVQAQTLSDAQRRLLQENMMQADANSDGMLDRSEFEALIRLNAEDDLGRAAMIVQADRFGAAFARIDGNGDGVVTATELQAMAQRLRG
ncbi:hypothetical protein [Roseivivax isoporae]|uniref:EF-hand domain-containing protein n=1 Tax=Roseivivax isoporae LMG 25204 TaxID=1449351 RepID=X7F3V3_9RHOB|nr:hypothetical protein [Roseivivax isoporae]ETX26744.1 hypothetical protein RISW2_19460 [Roseivivax isoporae LMG 25204]